MESKLGGNRMENRIYLDNAATTFPKPEAVYLEMDRVNRSLAFHAGRGSYSEGRQAEHILKSAREGIRKLVQCSRNEEVVLTASATLACNQILGGLRWKSHDVVYVSPFEHNAVMRPLFAQQEKYGFIIQELPLDFERLEIDLDKTEYYFARRPPDYLFMTHVSNVTGYILPVKKLSSLAHKFGKPVILLDASQSLGLLSVDFKGWGLDYLVFAGHKTLYGPFGIAGFLMNREPVLDPFITGGTGIDSLNRAMPDGARRYEPGSRNVIAAAGLCSALQELEKKGSSYDHEKKLVRELAHWLSKESGIRLYLPEEDRHTGILAWNILGMEAADVERILDEKYGIAVRSGYHCAPLIHKYMEEGESRGVVRISVSRFTAQKEIRQVYQAILEIKESYREG